MPWKDKEYSKSYYRSYYSKRMSDYRQYLGNKCAFCGWCKIPKVLEFAHKRGTIKLFSIAHVMKKSKEHVIKEIEKCILLCPTCHRVYDLEGRTSAC